MSDEYLHVAVGAWIGEVVDGIPNEKINGPFVAALLGFASHVLCDTIDHDYTINFTDPQRLKEDAPYVAMQIGGIAIELYQLLREKDKKRFQTKLAGILGSVAPDVIDGVYAYLHPDKWQSGEMLFPWHKAYGDSKPQEMSKQMAMARTAIVPLFRFRWRF